MSTLLTGVFIASLLGSLHCVGMCGGFVAFYSGADGSGGARRLLSHAAYSGGRLVAYSILGLAAGAIGAALDLAGSLAGVQRIAAVAAGAVMIAWGILALLQIGGVKVFKHGSNSAIAGWLRPRDHPGRGPPSGGAGRRGRPPLGGPALRLAVGLCRHRRRHRLGAERCSRSWRPSGPARSPILLALGLGAQILSVPLRRHIPALTAVILVALGLYAIIGRPTTALAAMTRNTSTPPMAPSHHPTTPRPAAVETDRNDAGAPIIPASHHRSLKHRDHGEPRRSHRAIPIESRRHEASICSEIGGTLTPTITSPQIGFQMAV